MIKWYKSSEKMPEIGDCIIYYNSCTKYIFKTVFGWYEIIKGEKIICSGGIFTHWAYASEFNFPKETK